MTVTQHRANGTNGGVVWDNHICLPLKSGKRFLPELERYRDAGVHVVSINVGYGNMTAREHLAVLRSFRNWLAKRPNHYCLVSSSDDVKRCKEQGKLGITFDIEGMSCVADNPEMVQKFYELGVRWMLITYNQNNEAGGGCLDIDRGLTDVGRSLIDEMERVGMVLCLSHAGARTAAEALDYVTNPPIYSHSNPYGCTAHVRNVSDTLLKKCAQKGGVIGLSGIGLYLGAERNLPQALVHQIRYVADLVGPDHVGLGLDYVFDKSELEEEVQLNPALFPPGVGASLPMIEPEAIWEIVEGLARSNFQDQQIRGILGENWLRIAKTVWR